MRVELKFRVLQDRIALSNIPVVLAADFFEELTSEGHSWAHLKNHGAK